MGEHRQFRIQTSRSSQRGRRRETFKIAVTVRPQAHGTGGSQRALDDAEKIFESLVRSGRLAHKK